MSLPVLIDEFMQEGHYFVVEELFHGQSLRQRTDFSQGSFDRGLTQADLIDIAVQLACMLREVHRPGIVIRDFSPNNIIVTQTAISD